jgi:hypothetical protein
MCNRLFHAHTIIYETWEKFSQVEAKLYSNEATVWLQAMEAGFI